MKMLNMVIPILMHFCSLILNWSVASRIKQHIIQRDVSDGDVKLHLYILLQTFSVIQSDVALQKHVH